MPAPLLPKSELLARLSDTFRRLGYDGASITDIASATGLGKSSLYHYFPGGKEQMAADVLTDLAQALEANLFAPLSGAGRPDEKLKQMIETIDAFYDGGRKACLLERLAASAGRNNLQAPLRALPAVDEGNGIALPRCRHPRRDRADPRGGRAGAH